MKLSEEFNKKYKNSLKGEGMLLEYKAIAGYMDALLGDLIKIPGFEWYEIGTRKGMGYLDCNLEELIPCVGRIMIDEIGNKLNFILKVEYEVERRMLLTAEIGVDSYEQVTQS